MPDDPPQAALEVPPKNALENPIVLCGADGKQTPGSAEVVRYSQATRVTFAVMYVLGGLLGGLFCIVVPVVHLFTTWGLPVLGVLMAIRAMRRTVVVYHPEGACPACGAMIQLVSGPIDDTAWQHCPDCQAALQIRLA